MLFLEYTRPDCFFLSETKLCALYLCIRVFSQLQLLEQRPQHRKWPGQTLQQQQSQHPSNRPLRLWSALLPHRQHRLRPARRRLSAQLVENSQLRLSSQRFHLRRANRHQGNQQQLSRRRNQLQLNPFPLRPVKKQLRL